MSDMADTGAQYNTIQAHDRVRPLLVPAVDTGRPGVI